MDERIISISDELSKDLNISLSQFLDLCKIGCKIAFKDSLDERIKALGGFDTTEELSEFLLTLQCCWL